ncbi:unnamed protein product [Owenia fusiformis]|uniref:Lipoma HMGIC fusion partner-like 2 protein n=1 Tax=Owenia fusiformis TaxID=6347 RepID=A0A8S4P7E3_OWEFU|nr:unnamed protein product [Owenia fusiformis]
MWPSSKSSEGDRVSKLYSFGFDEKESEDCAMCYVIVTCRSMLWTLLTVAATLAIAAALITPQWLIGTERQPGLKSRSNLTTDSIDKSNAFKPTIGIYNRCTKEHHFRDLYTDKCAPFVDNFFTMPDSEFPHFWKASLVIFILAIMLLVFTVFTAVISLCVRAMCRKSIFTISGLIQSIAGLLLIVGLVLYPAGWGSQKIKNLCGDDASAFNIAGCSLGWAFYTCVGGTVAVFICATLSIQAEVATSSDKVEDDILQGKHLICLP